MSKLLQFWNWLFGPEPPAVIKPIEPSLADQRADAYARLVDAAMRGRAISATFTPDGVAEATDKPSQTRGTITFDNNFALQQMVDNGMKMPTVTNSYAPHLARMNTLSPGVRDEVVRENVRLSINNQEMVHQIREYQKRIKELEDRQAAAEKYTDQFRQPVSILRASAVTAQIVVEEDAKFLNALKVEETNGS